jgi:glycosyltransferase involved in cell wall biosynthesis
LIPSHRLDNFINQDLDPYLQRLYLGYGAAPKMEHCILQNLQGGSDMEPARYERVVANGWCDFVIEDLRMICQHQTHLINSRVIDVGIPTYRLDFEYLKRICSLDVPGNWRTCFIVIVDNPSLLLERFRDHEFSESSKHAAKNLECMLTKAIDGRNNVRVRVNPVNSGASASRNHAIRMSAAEYILFLDDDIIPSQDLLFQYDKVLGNLTKETSEDDYPKVYGLIGMVRFPRSPSLSLLHGGVLMSNLIFVFEIAQNPIYHQPAWGVTANILVRRRSFLLFDTDYAKTGGGEDVDFCLRMNDWFLDGSFFSAPDAIVEHPFWSGGFWSLSRHFYSWAIGDSALFRRFPQHTFRSWPNASESMVVVTFLTIIGIWWLDKVTSGLDSIISFVLWYFLQPCTSIIAVDIIIDMIDSENWQNRCDVLQPHPRDTLFLFAANSLANLYVIILEFGRLRGHFQRGNFSCMTLRFDWHCGRLPNHRQSMRHKDLRKFCLFFAIILMPWMQNLAKSSKSNL